MDRWERRAAVAAYALTMGSLPSSSQGVEVKCETRADKGEQSVGELAKLSAWFEEGMARWLRSERRAREWCEVKEAVMVKLEWLLEEGPEQDALLWEMALMRVP